MANIIKQIKLKPILNKFQFQLFHLRNVHWKLSNLLLGDHVINFLKFLFRNFLILIGDMGHNEIFNSYFCICSRLWMILLLNIISDYSMIFLMAVKLQIDIFLSTADNFIIEFS